MPDEDRVVVFKSFNKELRYILVVLHRPDTTRAITCSLTVKACPIEGNTLLFLIISGMTLYYSFMYYIGDLNTQPSVYGAIVYFLLGHESLNYSTGQ